MHVQPSQIATTSSIKNEQDGGKESRSTSTSQNHSLQSKEHDRAANINLVVNLPLRISSHSTSIYLHPLSPYMMEYPPMVAPGLYMPFPPGPPLFFGQVPGPVGARSEEQDAAHPPGINPPASTTIQAPANLPSFPHQARQSRL